MVGNRSIHQRFRSVPLQQVNDKNEGNIDMWLTFSFRLSDGSELDSEEVDSDSIDSWATNNVDNAPNNMLK